MLSHASSLRYIIMVTVASASLTGITPHSTLAVPISPLTFDIELRSLANPLVAGIVKVSFSGDPGNHCPTDPNDCLLTEDELTFFSGAWIPAPIPNFQPPQTFPPPSFNILRQPPDIVQNATLIYHTDTQIIEDLDIADDSLSKEIGCQPATNTVAACSVNILRKFMRLHLESAGVDSDQLYIIQSYTLESSVIPEPSTWLLLSTGLAAMVGYALSRRRRSAVPRPAAGDRRTVAVIQA